MKIGTIGERMVMLEQNIHYIKNRVDSLYKKLDSLDKKFANKWVERAFIGVFITIVGMIVTILMG